MAMSNATIIDMKARPVNSANLCFEVSGILDQLVVQLGWPVQDFNFDFFYSNLTVYTAPGDPSRLAYDSYGILSDPTYVRPSTLATLRAAPVAAALDKAIRVRQNEFYAKYATAWIGLPGMQPITNMLYNLYGPGSGTKLDLLQQLGNVAANQTNALLGAYTANSIRNPSGPQGGVVKRTWSHQLIRRAQRRGDDRLRRVRYVSAPSAERRAFSRRDRLHLD
jgi:hypothetical protein